MRKKRRELWEELLLLESIKEENKLTVNQIQRKVELLSENMELLDDEELYCYKRAHETWLLKGDNNTEFFHRVACYSSVDVSGPCRPLAH